MAVAGYFYPAEPEVLRRNLDTLLTAADTRAPPVGTERPKALIVPHAGYVYSGPIAATAYAHLRRVLGAGPHISRVVLLGPAHRVWCRGLAEPGVDFLETPLGAVPVDRAALTGLPGRSDGRRAHVPEHSLEVQLPFLRTLLPHATVVPLLVCDAEPSLVADGLAYLWGGPETLVIISTDLSHFLPAEQARTQDARTARHITLQGAPELRGEQACGAAALNGFLRHISGRGWRVDCLDLRHSGDTAGGTREVVGYGAFALYTGPGGSA